MLCTETLCRSREASGRLSQCFADHKNSTDLIFHFEPSDLLSHAGICGIRSLAGHDIQRVIGNEAIDATAFMFKLTHRLFESISLNTDEIDGGNTNISKKDFTKMAIGCHVRNRTHFNTR